jgi:integrase
MGYFRYNTSNLITIPNFYNSGVYLKWVSDCYGFLNEPLSNRLLENSYDIRSIQELPGHRNLQTVMIYTHVASKNILGVRSSLDK